MSPDLTPITFLEQMLYKGDNLLMMLIVTLFVGFILWVVDKYGATNWDILAELKLQNMAVAIVVAAVILGLSLIASEASGATNKHDGLYQKYTQEYWGDTVDWRLFKAQGLQESGLRSNVCSPAGACGIAQFMPATARQFRIDPFNVKESIEAQILYMRQLYNQFAKRPRPHMDKMAFAAGSYNWGLGNILRKAQPCAAARMGSDLLWADVVGCTPLETREYWPRIVRFFSRLIGGFNV